MAFVKCGYSRDHEPQSRGHLLCSACCRVITYHRPLWIHQELIYNVIVPAFLLLKFTTPRVIALENGADEALHCADFVGAALDHHFLLLFSLMCVRSRTKQTNCSTYCLSNVNSKTLPFCALLRHGLTH